MYITEFKENIQRYLGKYNYLDDKGLKWNLIKMEVRSFIIAYSNKKAR